MSRKRAKRPRGMGQVFNKGGTWCLRWRENGRRMFKSGYPDADTASRVLQKILVDVAEGKPAGSPDPKNLPTLTELAKPWLERRVQTHRSSADDRCRWGRHVGPFFGQCKPPEVDGAMIRRFVEAKLLEGLSAQTVRHCVRLLSNLYADIVERGYCSANPIASLPRTTRRLIRSTHDPRGVPFLEKQDDVRRVFLALGQPFSVIFALGALAGLRPGEVIGLEWGDLDLRRGRMLVQRTVRYGKAGPTKNGKPRPVPLIPALVKILAEYKLATGGEGRLFPANAGWREGKPGAPGEYISVPAVREKVADALRACGLPETLTLYQVTRHTHAAQHVLAGGSLATLREVLGHASVTTTERYAHLREDLFRPSDLLQLHVDLSRPGGDVVDLAAHREERAAVGHSSGTDQVDEGDQNGVSTRGSKHALVAQLDRASAFEAEG